MGNPVSATDEENTTLTYSLEGSDASSFSINSSSGQIRTGAGVTYNYESGKTNYSLRVKAIDQHGGSRTIGVTVNINDLAEPPAKPDRPTASQQTLTSITFQWQEPGNTGPPIESYSAQWRAGASGGWKDVSNVDTTRSITLTGLQQNMTYQMRVQATNDEGGSPWSEPGTSRTNQSPAVEISFEHPEYSVPEGSTQTLTVTLSADPEREVTVLIVLTHQGGATTADYNIAPDLPSLTFDAGETEKTITFTATQDTEDDDDESVQLAFGSPLPDRVSQGTNWQATVNIRDDDDPAVAVSFEQSSYAVPEGGEETVRVTLSADPERTVSIPIVTTHQGGATTADYNSTLVPSALTFNRGETEKTFVFTATQDSEDDDGESVTLVFGSTLPDRVSPGTIGQTTIIIGDNDDPSVTVGFDQASYDVPEASSRTIRVTLSEDPERTVTVPVEVTQHGGATAADYDLTPDPPSLTFNAGETEKTITFTATQDTENDDNESVKLTFGPMLPDRVSRGTNGEATVNIGDDDDPAVDVTLGQGSDSQVSHTVPEGGSHTVTVTLSADPEQTLTIPILVTHQGGTTDADYDLTPDPPILTFNAGETEKTIIFTATQDTLDDDGESVILTYGNLPAGVSGASAVEITLHIQDDDDPVATVQFEHPEYSVFEGGEVTLAVVLSADPEREVTVPLTRTNQEGTSDADYSGVPPSVTFASGEVRQTFVFTSLEDTEHEDGESVKLGFGTRPARVSMGANDETTVTIRDCEGGGIWCAALKFGVLTDSAAGRKWLRREHLDHDQFVYNGMTYGIGTITLRPNRGGVANPGAPFSIPERATLLFSLVNLSATDPADRYSMPNEDHLDWTLHISADNDGETLEAALPFNEAKFCCGRKWRWYGLDLDELNAAWEPDKLYQLRIVEDPRADRVAEALGPPLYLEVTGSTRRSVGIRWVRPQIRNDGAPPGVSYRIEWKESAGSWDTADDVSEQVYEPRPGEEWLGYTIRGLTPGVWYNVRVIAVNEAGDSEPSNVVSFTTQPDPDGGQQAEPKPNNPATGAPGISGTPSVGGTLTADVSGIGDADGLENAAFTYQWLAGDAEIAGATGARYTVVSADEGKAIRVRVSFTDDADNEETLTSAATAAVTAAALRLNSATVDGAALVLTYNETLDEGVSLPLTAFTVTVDGTARSLSQVAVSGSAVILTLAQAAAGGDTVTVDYTRPDGPDFIRDTRGNVAGSFSGQAVTNSTPEEESSAGKSEQPAANTPASGDPKIRGTAGEGETLTVDTSGISDEDGMENATFSYQWTAGSDDIDGATSATFMLTRDEVGLSIRVRLSFTDDAGNEESLTSAPTAAVAAAPSNTPATGTPVISGIIRVGETLTADTSGIADEDGLTNVSYSYQWVRSDGNDDTDIGGETSSTYTLHADDQGNTIKVKVSFTDDAGNEETLTSQATAAVAARPNTPATGLPTINGMAEVGETLVANTTRIADEDGLDNTAFSHQWIANDGATDTDIQDATASTYTPSVSDVGKTIKVRVSFTDDGRNAESLTSAATAEVATTVPTEPLSLTVTRGDQIQELDASWQAPASNGGSAITGYKVQRKESADSWNTVADVSEDTVTGTTHTITELTGGVEYAVRVIATNAAGDGPASAEATGTPAGGVSEQNAEPENNAPTGLPTISGTAQVGQTLTAVTTGIADADGLENVTFSYQWIAGDADIQGATNAATYTLTSDQQGLNIQVWVTFTDDAGNPEDLTSAATEAVAAARPPLTAKFLGAPESHDGRRRIHLRTPVQRGVRHQLRYPAGPRLHGDRRLGDRGAAAGASGQHPVGDNRRAGLRRRRGHHTTRHPGLRGQRGHLYLGRQDAVQPAGRDRPGA